MRSKKGFIVSSKLLMLFVVLVSAAGLGYSADGYSAYPPFKLPPSAAAGWVENEVAVLLTPSTTDEQLQALNDEFGCVTVRRARYMKGLCKLRFPGPVSNYTLARLSSKGFVLTAERNGKYYPLDVPNDPLYMEQWALQPDHIYAQEAWDIEKGKWDVTVAVIDTGVRDRIRLSERGPDRYPHPDLAFVRRYCPSDVDLYTYDSGRLLTGLDFTEDDLWRSDPSPSESKDPIVVAASWHGTFVAGIVAAKTNNFRFDASLGGVASLCWQGVWILPLKVFPENATGGGYGADSVDIADAIMYCIYRGDVDVINMSLGALYGWEIMRYAVAQAVAAGIVVVAAAGNSWGAGPYPPLYPAAYEGVICVGATGYTDIISWFSNRGRAVDIVAPGESILSTIWRRNKVDDEAIDEFYQNPRICDPSLPEDPRLQPYEYDIWGNGYTFDSGTSAASPIVAAAAALLRSLNVPPEDVEPILRETATPRGVGRPNDAYGWGLLNVYKALKMACIDVKIQSPTHSGVIPTTRPRLRVDFRHADPDTISVWVDPVDSDGDGVPDNSPTLSGTDPDFDTHFFLLDEAAGKSYVQFEYQVTPGTHTIYAKAGSELELDTPPPAPLTDEDRVAFTVAPQTLKRGWHLLSVPYYFDTGTTPEQLFAGNSGVLARWHYANNAYGEYAIYSLDGTRTDPEAGFAPPSVLDEEGRLDEKLVHPFGMPYEATPPAGLGYWAYTSAPVEFPESTGKSVDNAPYVIRLYQGWNIVGNPFPFAIDWGGVVVDYAGTQVPIAEAVENGWLFGYSFRYDNIYRRYRPAVISTATLKPWEAQWVKVSVRGPDGWPQPDVRLIVAPNPYTGIIR